MTHLDRYFKTRDLCRRLEKYGFKYSRIRNSLILSHPYVPEGFKDLAVEVKLYHPAPSSLSRIDSLEYYRRGSGYERVEEPDCRFREYVNGILESAVSRCRAF